jgi:hypothetical protein
MITHAVFKKTNSLPQDVDTQRRPPPRGDIWDIFSSVQYLSLSPV